MDMKTILVLLVALVAALLVVQVASDRTPSLKAIFPYPKNKRRYIRLNEASLNDLVNFTICSWVKLSNLDHKQNIFSYATMIDPDTIRLWVEKGQDGRHMVNFRAFGGAAILSEFRPNFIVGAWRHLCVAWSTLTPSGNLYVNGHKGSGLVTGRDLGGKGKHKIPGGGVVIVGQDQNSVGGAFDTTGSFEGELFDLQVWDRRLNDDEIDDLSGCDMTLSGNVYSWLVSPAWFRGGVILSRTSVCFNEDGP